MKLAIKALLILVVLFVLAVLSAPLWGGCGFNEQICDAWCELRHYGSDLERITCKASCVADKASCLAK